jgi:hypothetical protein
MAFLYVSSHEGTKNTKLMNYKRIPNGLRALRVFVATLLC